MINDTGSEWNGGEEVEGDEEAEQERRGIGFSQETSIASQPIRVRLRFSVLAMFSSGLAVELCSFSLKQEKRIDQASHSTIVTLTSGTKCQIDRQSVFHRAVFRASNAAQTH
jgi:hypothetical protein